MSEVCEIFAEVVITTAKTLPPGGATMALGQANLTMCFYAPQTAAALPATLAAGGAIDAWAQFIQHSDAFAELNKMAFDKGCRLVISPVDEAKDTWRMMVVTVDDTSKTAREVAVSTSRTISNTQGNAKAWLNFMDTPSGILWLMNQMAGHSD